MPHEHEGADPPTKDNEGSTDKDERPELLISGAAGLFAGGLFIVDKGLGVVLPSLDPLEVGLLVGGYGVGSLQAGLILLGGQSWSSVRVRLGDLRHRRRRAGRSSRGNPEGRRLMNKSGLLFVYRSHF